MFRQQRGQAQASDQDQGELLRGVVVAAFEHLEERQQQGVVVGGFGHPQIRDGLPNLGLDLGALIGDEAPAEGVRGGAGGDEVLLPAVARSGEGTVLHRPGRQENGIVGNRDIEGELIDQFGVVHAVGGAAFQHACDEVAGPFRTVAGHPGEQPVAGDGHLHQPPDVPGGEDLGALRGGGADRHRQQNQTLSTRANLLHTSAQGWEGLADRFADHRTVCLGEIVEDCDEVFKRLRLGYQSGQCVGIPSHGMNLSAMGDKSTRDHRRFGVRAGRVSPRPGGPAAPVSCHR